MNDAKQVASNIVNHVKNATIKSVGADIVNIAKDPNTAEDIFGGFVSGAAFTKISKFGSISKISNPIPNRLARVIPSEAKAATIGISDEVFVTAADDISGLSAKEIAKKLTIPESASGFRIFEFDTPTSGLSTPIISDSPGFIGGGRTAGGAREFNLPNLKIEELKGLNIEIKF